MSNVCNANNSLGKLIVTLCLTEMENLWDLMKPETIMYITARGLRPSEHHLSILSLGHSITKSFPCGGILSYVLLA